MKQLYLFLFFLLILFSCKKDNPTVSNLGQDYFPADAGHYVIYDVDSILYNDNTGTVDTFRYQLKELIASEFVDNSGRNSFRFERYIRSNDSAAWVLNDVWQGAKTTSNVELTEENIPYVKLTFPVKKGNKWNGNAFNSLGEAEYQYENANVPLTVNGLPFDSTATVLQQSDSNLIEKKLYKETYAKHVGLILKEITDVKTEINGKIKSGYAYIRKVKSYNK